MENKTLPNIASVDTFIGSLDDPQQRDDCKKLLQIFSQVSGEEPVMWGTAIVGYGMANLTYASGRNVQWPMAGFSPRKGKISLYVTFDAEKLTGKFPNLGKHKTGKGCIYIKTLADVDMSELEKLIKAAWQDGYGQPNHADGKEQIVSVDEGKSKIARNASPTSSD